MPWYANIEEAYGPIAGSENTNVPPPVEPPAPQMENSVEVKAVHSHEVKSPFTQGQGVIRQVNSETPLLRSATDCEKFRLHVRNCPSCQEYFRNEFAVKKSSLIENFGNIMNYDYNNLDIFALIGIGVFIIFVLDSLMRLRR